MFTPEDKHWKFLETCVSNDTKTHIPPSDISQEDLEQLVSMGVLIAYNSQGSKTRYASTGLGGQILRNHK